MGLRDELPKPGIARGKVKIEEQSPRIHRSGAEADRALEMQNRLGCPPMLRKPSRVVVARIAVVIKLKRACEMLGWPSMQRLEPA